MIERTIFREEHQIFRETVRRFVDREIVPFHAKWEEDGIVPRELWLKAGAAGLLCCTVPEAYGGMGLDYLFDVVVFEEVWRVGASGPGFLIHTDLVATYILSFGTDEQRRHWLPKMVRGEAIGSLGMTEPHAGSDLKAIRTKAVRNGDEFVINGQKIADFQNTQFKLAELDTLATMARVYTDKCIELFMAGRLDPVDAAKAKMFVCETHCRVVDECLQLFGGWGYMWEYPIARAYADARIVKIAGGSIEVMKHIIGRQMFSQYQKEDRYNGVAGINPA